jgi:hypothetical protein
MRIFLAILIFAGCLALGSLVGCFAGFMIGFAAMPHSDNMLVVGLVGWGLGAVVGIAAAIHYIRRMR